MSRPLFISACAFGVVLIPVVCAAFAMLESRHEHDDPVDLYVNDVARQVQRSGNAMADLILAVRDGETSDVDDAIAALQNASELLVAAHDLYLNASKLAFDRLEATWTAAAPIVDEMRQSANRAAMAKSVTIAAVAYMAIWLFVGVANMAIWVVIGIAFGIKLSVRVWKRTR